MRPARSVTSFVEGVHAPQPDLQSWLAELYAVGARAFDGHLGAVAYVVRTGGHRPILEQQVGDLCDAMLGIHELADERINDIYRGGPVSRASAHMPASNPHEAYERAKALGVPDIIGAVGLADCDRACVVAYALPSASAPVSRRARVLLARIAAHLSTSYRMRLGPSEDGAVLSPDGELLHADDPRAKERASRDRLRAAAADIVRAKRESARDPGAGLELWRAMVEGRWTLVDRTDTDGKRLLVAKRNAPSAIRVQSLTERERGVLERVALGGSLRHVAYELGLAESTVSETLSRAMHKLGLRSRAELVELRAALGRDSASRDASRDP